MNQKRHLLAQRRKGRKEIQILVKIDTRTNWIDDLSPIIAWFPLRSWRALRETAFSIVIRFFFSIRAICKICGYGLAQLSEISFHAAFGEIP
jgi:hypothetical protein